MGVVAVTCLDAALDYTRRGWAVLPCWWAVQVAGRWQCACPKGPQCSPSPAKHPLTPHGFQDATINEAAIRAWWARWPSANVAIATGKVSGIVVVDIDPRNGGDDTLAELFKQHGAFPRTPQVLTGGGGAHFYFEIPDVALAGKLGRGIDVKSDGGYVLLPPSNHVSGRTYEWEITTHPDDVPLAEMPDWMLKQLTTPRATTEVPLAKKSTLPLGKRALTFVANGAKVGDQRIEAVAAARSYLSGGYTVQETAEALWRGFQVSPQGEGREPWMFNHALEIARDIASKPPSKPLEARGNEHNPDAPPKGATDNASPIYADVRLVRLADVAPEKVRWLWPGYVPYGKVTLLAGDPGLGKSWASLDLAARVSVGGETPDRKHRVEMGGVVLLTAEDGLADTVRPRVDSQGGDASRVNVLDAVFAPDGRERLPSLLDDVGRLEDAVRSIGARLVIIDPLNAFMGRTDSHIDAEVRRALTPLAKMAERTGAAVVVVMHLNQATLQPVLYRVQGSIGYVGAARSVLLVARDKNNPSLRILAPIKANLAGEMPALSFTITEEPALAWQGAVEADIAELLAPPSREREEAPQQAEAEAFLRAKLTSGPVLAKDVRREAEGAGIAKRTLDRAKANLRVRSEKVQEGGEKGKGPWLWSLPDSHCQLPTHTTLGNVNGEGQKTLLTGAFSSQNRGGNDGTDSHCQPAHVGDGGNVNPNFGEV